MHFKLPKNLLPIALSVVALLIWGHNGYKFFTGVKSSDEFTIPQRPVLENSSIVQIRIDGNEDGWAYEPKYRDPFENWLTAKKTGKKPPPKKTKKTPKPKPAPPPTPKLRLTGIIKDPNGALAIIEDLQDRIFFAHAGDSVAGVKIVFVDSSRIDCEFQRLKFTLTLK